MFNLLKYLLCFGSPFMPGAVAQNLIQNGSFENHQSLDCLSCHQEAANFAATMNQWQSLNTGSPFICDCHYKKNAGEVKNRWCRFDKVSPQDG